MRWIDRCLWMVLCVLAMSCGALADDSSGDGADREHEYLYPARQDGKWGFIDQSGDFVIEPTYTARPGKFSQGLTSITVKGKIGFIDTSGKVVIEPKLNWAQAFGDGLAPARSGIFAGFIDRQGKWHLRGRYGTFHKMINGAAVVKDAAGRRYQLIDREGKELLPSHFQGVKWTGTWPVVVLHDGEWYFVGKDGSRGMGGTYKEMIPSKQGLTFASRDRRTWKLLNAQRQVVVDGLEFRAAQPFSEGAAAVRRGVRWQFIDRTGRPLFEQDFRRLIEPGFVEGLAGVYNDQYKLGFIDKAGKWVIEPAYEEGEAFDHGLALVKQGGLYRYIDKTGATVWQEQRGD